MLYNNQGGALATSGTDVTNSSSATAINFAVAPDFATLSGSDFIPLILNPGSTVAAGSPGAFEIVHMTAYTATATTGTVLRQAEDATNWPECTHPTPSTWVCGPTIADGIWGLTPTAKSANYTAEPNDLVQMSGANTVTLPTPALSAQGRPPIIGIISVNGTVASPCSVSSSTNGGYILGPMMGLTSQGFTLNGPGNFIILEGDGTNWNIISGEVGVGGVSPTLTQIFQVPELISAVPSLVGNQLTLTLASAMTLTVGNYLNISGAANGGGGANWANINGDWLIYSIGGNGNVGTVASSTTVIVLWTGGTAPTGAYSASSATATPDFVPIVTGQYEIECIGGGGGGGGAGSSVHTSGIADQVGGAGGGQGASVKQVQTLIAGTAYQCSVGLGGASAAGGAAGGHAGTGGNSGASTTFTGASTLVAPGGGGGSPSGATSTTASGGGAYGSPVGGDGWYLSQSNATSAGNGGSTSSATTQGGNGGGAGVGSGAGGGQGGGVATSTLGGTGGGGASFSSPPSGVNNTNTATASGSAGGTGAQPGGGGGGGGGGSEGASASGIGGGGGAGGAGGIIIRGPYPPMVASL